MIQHHVHGVEVFGSSAMPLQHMGREITLQGSEAEAVPRIVSQNELNQAVA
jgi:hypothetical protein